MEDMLSGGGPERQPPRWQRPLVAVAVLSLAVAGLVKATGGGKEHATQPRPTPPATSAPASPTATLPPPTGPELNGVQGRLPAGTELVVGGQHPAVLGGTTQWLSRLPVRPDQALTGAFAVDGGIVAQVQRLQFSSTGPSSRIYFVRHDGVPRLLGSADKIVPRFDGKAVFALTLARDTQPGVLTELSLSGKQLARHVAPFGFSVWSDSPAGLVVTSDPEPGDEYPDLRVVDPATLVLRRDYGEINDVDAASSTQVAWIPTGCLSRCSLSVAGLSPGGGLQHLEQAAGYTAGDIAVSPDGETLAISWIAQSTTPATGFVEVVNLPTGVRRTVPGVTTAVEQTADLAWTPDGRALGVGVELGGGVRRIGLWPLAGGPVQLLPEKFTEDEDSASTLLAL